MDKLKVRVTRRDGSDGIYFSIDQIEPIRSKGSREPPSKGSREPPNPKKQEIKKAVREALDKAPKLKKFLEENNALGKFIKNTTKRKLEYPNIKQAIENIKIFTVDSHEAINYAFKWWDTREGDLYWRNLDRKLRNKFYK